MVDMALSIRQPWAWAILYAGKDIENRTWSTRFRGRILIHAGKAWDGSKMDAAEDVKEWAQKVGIPAPELSQIPLGGIVGEAEIVDCVKESSSPWFMGFGQYGFVLRNARPLPFRPYKGELGFFKVISNELGEK